MNPILFICFPICGNLGGVLWLIFFFIFVSLSPSPSNNAGKDILFVRGYSIQNVATAVFPSWKLYFIQPGKRYEWSHSFSTISTMSESEVAQSCPTLCDPMDCSLPDSSAHGIFQARVLEWGAIAFSNYVLWVSKSFHKVEHITFNCHTEKELWALCLRKLFFF